MLYCRPIVASASITAFLISVIEAEATIGPQYNIADSVVANQAYLGAQVRTSNHRLVCNYRVGNITLRTNRCKPDDDYWYVPVIIVWFATTESA
ncbi:hypothetical protein PS011_22710, partial [Shigella sonnei]|nr:hypothetical protein [Shigella sonnei]